MLNYETPHKEETPRIGKLYMNISQRNFISHSFVIRFYTTKVKEFHFKKLSKVAALRSLLWWMIKVLKTKRSNSYFVLLSCLLSW